MIEDIEIFEPVASNPFCPPTITPESCIGGRCRASGTTSNILTSRKLQASYLREPGGSIHTLNAPVDNTVLTETWMVVTASNVNFDQNGNVVRLLYANSIIQMIDYLIHERGLGPARYITPPQPRYTV